jgi:hypothetical protein
MLSSRTRGLTIALVAAALSIVGVSAKAPDHPQKGIAPLCLLGAPPAECEDGPVS